MDYIQGLYKALEIVQELPDSVTKSEILFEIAAEIDDESTRFEKEFLGE